MTVARSAVNRAYLARYSSWYIGWKNAPFTGDHVEFSCREESSGTPRIIQLTLVFRKAGYADVDSMVTYRIANYYSSFTPSNHNHITVSGA